MPLVIGLDLGTTTITALALDTSSGHIAACATAANRAEVTPAKEQARGRSEWDAVLIAQTACGCLRELAGRLGARTGELRGLGITGQQHGVVLVDANLRPLTPLINWQDRRGEEPCAGFNGSWVEAARARVGEEAPGRAGCRLSAGYMAVTLFWLAGHGRLPRPAKACFVMDYLEAVLTGQQPVTDASCAASAGVLDVPRGDWDAAALAALGLPGELFPPVRPSGALLGGLTAELAGETALPAGLPVFVGIGDNQASFLGSVADRDGTVLVNVGTGGQVAAFTPTFAHDPVLETRPFPGGGYLLVSAGLSGGAAYAVLERFFRDAATQVLGITPPGEVYAAMNRLAEVVPAGADGLRCEPFFAGTRQRPDARASWTGLSQANFTPGHLARALLEGMAATFAAGYAAVRRARGGSAALLVGAGNGVRANPLLARIIAAEFGLPMRVPAHTEEAAFGAALLAAVGAGEVASLPQTGRLIRYAEG